MARIAPVPSNTDEIEQYWFHCPGCDRWHVYTVKIPKGITWKFNGDLDKPTFSPSLLNKMTYKNGAFQDKCHLFVKNGNIIFCNDSTHHLAGQTVDMEEV